MQNIFRMILASNFYMVSQDKKIFIIMFILKLNTQHYILFLRIIDSCIKSLECLVLSSAAGCS